MAKTKPVEETVEVPSAPSIRCKFQLANAMETRSDDQEAKRIYMFPVTGDNPDGSENENKSFARMTPFGTLEMLITNPDAFEFFQAGKQYYLDLIQAD